MHILIKLFSSAEPLAVAPLPLHSHSPTIPLPFHFLFSPAFRYSLSSHCSPCSDRCKTDTKIKRFVAVLVAAVVATAISAVAAVVALGYVLCANEGVKIKSGWCTWRRHRQLPLDHNLTLTLHLHGGKHRLCDTYPSPLLLLPWQSIIFLPHYH